MTVPRGYVTRTGVPLPKGYRDEAGTERAPRNGAAAERAPRDGTRGWHREGTDGRVPRGYRCRCTTKATDGLKQHREDHQSSKMSGALTASLTGR